MPTLSSQVDKYKLEATFDGVSFYTPINVADGYHTSRYVAALNQQIYSQAGATKDVLKEIMDEIVLRCNKSFDKDTFRTDVALLASNVLYRLKHPVDEHCAIRMGCLLTFAEYLNVGEYVTENTDRVDLFWEAKKETIAMNNPDAYAFFLQLGIVNTPQYSSHLNTLNEPDYFSNRAAALKVLYPQ